MSTLKERLADCVQAQAEFVQVSVQLDPEKREQPGVCGDWSPKDVVAHLVGWDQAFLEFINDPDNFIPPDDIDLFNERSVQVRKQLSWSVVMQEMEINFRQLQQAVASVNADMKIYDWTMRWLGGRTEDYDLHRSQFEVWVG